MFAESSNVDDIHSYLIINVVLSENYKGRYYRLCRNVRALSLFRRTDRRRT